MPNKVEKSNKQTKMARGGKTGYAKAVREILQVGVSLWQTGLQDSTTTRTLLETERLEAVEILCEKPQIYMFCKQKMMKQLLDM